MWKQLEHYAVFLFLTDVQGLDVAEKELSRRFQRYQSKVLFCVNKVDVSTEANVLRQAYQLGMGEPLMISCKSFLGVEQLKQRISEHLQASKN